MPAQGSGNKPQHVESQQRRRKRPTVSRPAPTVQPGPFRASERRVVERHRRSPGYRQVLAQTRAERVGRERVQRIARQQERGYGSQARAVESVAARREALIAELLAQTAAPPPRLDPAPFARQQRIADAHVDRARATLPRLRLPRVPIIVNPTASQARAASKIITSAITDMVGPKGSGRERLERRRMIEREIFSNPDYREFADAVEHYARATEEHRALTQARSQGARGSREQRLAAGRRIVDERARTNRVSRKAPPLQIRAAGIPIPLGAVGEALEDFGAHLASGHGGSLARSEALGAVAGDVKTLATAPFVAAVEMAGAAGDLLQYLPDTPAGPLGGVTRGEGSTKRARELAAGAWEGIKESAPGQLVQGDLEGVVEAFERDPLISLLDFGAVSSVGGRVAGAVSRGAGKTGAPGVRGKLADVGSTVRPALALGEDLAAGHVKRRYSKDLTRKAAQVQQDRAREPLRRADGSVVTIEDQGRQVPVLKASQRERDRLTRRRGDFLASRSHNVESVAREEADRAGKVKGVGRKRSRDVVAMVVEGTVLTARTLERDLARERDRIKARLDKHEQTGTVYRSTAERDTARAKIAAIEKVLKSPKALAAAERIVAAGETHGRRLNEGDAEAIRLGLIDEEQAKRRRLIPVAVTHMGARHFSTEDHKRLEREAFAVEKAARAKMDDAPTPAARKEWRDAREARIAVSGRDPRKVKAHELAVARVRSAQQREKRAASAVRELEKRRAKILGGQAVRRGQDAQRGALRAYYVGQKRFEKRADAEAWARSHGGRVRAVALSAAEARRMGAVEQIDRALAAKRAEHTEAKKAVTEAKQQLERNPRPKVQSGIRAGESTPGKRAGERLTDDEIVAFLKAEGRDPDTIGYLPHRPDLRSGKRSVTGRMDPMARPNLAREATTGEAYRKGATESSEDLIRDAGVRQQAVIAKARQIDRLIGDHGMRHPAWGKAQRGEPLSRLEQRIVDRGGYFNSWEAMEVARRVEHDTGEKLVLVRAFAAKLDRDTQRIIQEEFQGPAAMDALGSRLLNDRIVKPGTDGRARNVVLVRQELIDQLQRHLAPKGPVRRFFEWINRPFRYSVLTQPRWLTGNFVEPYFVRLTMVGSGLNVFGLAVDLAAAHRTLRLMERSDDPKMREAAQELRAHTLGGLFLGGRGANAKRTVEEVPGLAWAAIVRDLPVIRQTWDLLRVLPDAYFKSNRVIESIAQRAALGKELRSEIQEFTGSWMQTVRLAERALEDAARGLTDTPTQHRFMKEQHRILGMYEGFPPWVRDVLAFTPFLPWVLNAARFVFWTMPTSHTATTALLIKVNDVVAKDWEELHRNTPPGGLRFAVPTKSGGWVDLARYTPYGLTAPIVGSDLEDFQPITDQLLPQFSGAIEAIHGRDPFNRQLRIHPTENQGNPEPTGWQRVGIAGYALMEALTGPYLQTVRRLREGGGTAYAGSTAWDPDTKPGTDHMSGFRRTLDPLRPTYLQAPASPGERSQPGGADPNTPRVGSPSPGDVDAMLRAIGVQRSGGSSSAGLSQEQIDAMLRGIGAQRP